MSAGLKERLAEALERHRAGDVGEAILSYRAVLAEEPDNADALNLLASALRAAGHIDEALVLAQKAARSAPERADVLYNCGNALSAAGKSTEAAAMFRAALEIAPDYAEAAANLGIALARSGETEAAVVAYRRALALNPTHRIAGLNLGNLLGEIGRLDDSLAQLRQVVADHPDLPEAHYNLGLGLLRLGDFTTGFEAYEWRWRTSDFSSPLRHIDRPAWDGRPFRGQRLLVHAEQGLGDTLQFIRLLKLAASLGGSITFEAPSSLLKLLQGVAGADEITDKADASQYDWQVPLLSLPLRLGLTLGSIPARVPYLAADPERRAAWGRRLKPDEPHLIGVAWRGNPASPADKGRSLPDARLLAPLAAIPGVRLLALHKLGPGDLVPASTPTGWRIAGLPFPIEHPGLDFDGGSDAFLDTAAVMSIVDAVVTTDTSIAHLAGALARPTIVLLKAVPDWRWLCEREDTPWYPTMTLARQSVAGDFVGPIEAAARFVAARLGG